MDYVKNDFLLENLILESEIVYSNRLKQAFNKIDDNISKKLIELENKDLNTVSNFFDLDLDNDNVITFTPDRIAQKIIEDNAKLELVFYNGGRGGWLTNNVEANKLIFDDLKYIPTTTEVYNPNNTEIGEIISKYKSDKSGKLWCYVKFENGQGVYNYEKLKPCDFDNKIIFNKNRQEVRIGRFVRMLLNLDSYKFTDNEIETFVNKLKSELSILNDVFYKFEIVSGEDLLYWYHRRNYLNMNGSLGSSCQAVGLRRWLEIYIDNPQTVQLVILKSEERDDKIVGRALLWELQDGKKMMDNIYVSKDSDKNVFKEYAKFNGWYTSNENKTFVAYLQPGVSYDYYPSIDTMNKWDYRTGKISNHDFYGSENIYWSDDEDDEE